MDAASDDSKTIFIIGSRAGSLKTAVIFLRNRGWTVQSSTDLRESITEILTLKPRYVLITADHASPRLRTVPALIQQAISARIILFADVNSDALLGLAREAGCSYLLYPPVSGPAIERMAWKIERDAERIADGGSTLYPEDVLRSEADKSKRPDAMVFSGERSKMNSEQESRTSGKLLSAEESGMQGRSLSAVATGPARGQRLSATGTTEGSSEFERPADQRGPLGTRKSGGRHRRTEAPLFEQEALPPEHALEDGPETGETVASDSVLVLGTQLALDESVTKTATRQDADIGVITRIGCIDIARGRFLGYLLVAWAGDQAIEERVLGKIRARLLEFMRQQGESVEMIEAVSLQVRDVTFEEWAEKQADFLRRSIHDGYEVAVAFFPGHAPAIGMKASAREDMIAMGIGDLQGDTRVEFDVYLHFPENDKFILYTKTGGVFQQKQKDRLREGGIKQVHVEKKAVAAVEKYRVQNHLNKGIEHLEGDKPKKS